MIQNNATRVDQKSTNLFFIILSFAIIYIVWGATYMFVAYAVEEIPPFLMAGMRYTTAAVLMFLLSYFFGQITRLSKEKIINALIAGVLFLGVGTGGVAWALQFVDSGLTALIISGEPLVIVLMMWSINKKRPSLQSFVGVFLGILGIYLLVSQREIIVDPKQWLGIGAIFVSICTWGYGTIFVNKKKLPESFMVSTGLQMLSGGMATLIFSLIVEKWDINLFELKFQTYFAMGFLVLFGGIIVFTAFNYLLKQVTPDKVATGTYVNPVIALALGWLFRDELVTNQSIIAAGIILSGVFFINSNK